MKLLFDIKLKSYNQVGANIILSIIIFSFIDIKRYKKYLLLISILFQINI